MGCNDGTGTANVAMASLPTIAATSSAAVQTRVMIMTAGNNYCISSLGSKIPSKEMGCNKGEEAASPAAVQTQPMITTAGNNYCISSLGLKIPSKEWYTVNEHALLMVPECCAVA